MKTKCYCGHTTKCDCGPETLEEAVERLFPMFETDYYFFNIPLQEREGFIAGAKWQQERICDSEVIQRIRATLSDAEARRIIRTI